MRAIMLSFMLFLSVVASGCGSGSERPPTHAVFGRITMDSKPVADANVVFHPVKTGTPPAIGRTDSDGNYELTTFNTNDGAIAAQYVITVNLQKSNDAMDEEIDLDDPGEAYGMMETEAPAEELLPAIYASPKTSPEKRTVVEGSNNFDFALTK